MTVVLSTFKMSPHRTTAKMQVPFNLLWTFGIGLLRLLMKFAMRMSNMSVDDQV